MELCEGQVQFVADSSLVEMMLAPTKTTTRRSTLTLLSGLSALGAITLFSSLKTGKIKSLRIVWSSTC